MTSAAKEFQAKREFQKKTIYSLNAIEGADPIKIAQLPFSIRILLENLLRYESSPAVTPEQIEALINWDGGRGSEQEVAFHPARVVLQDFTGVPAVVDLAAMRNAIKHMGGNASDINPLFPSELVIDHSVQVDSYGHENSLTLNRDHEYERNGERYQLLRWAQGAFSNFQVVPPATGIVHQVNLEYLARGAFEKDGVIYPDTLVGTDSHTTMINGIGILGWGVGGIEAEAAMLGQPINMLIPEVLGVRITGKPRAGITATDVVLCLTEKLRKVGVVGRFVEFFGAGLDHMALETRTTISNMSPEFGSTCAIFPVDAATLAYFKMTGRSEEQCQLIEDYFREQGLFRDSNTVDPQYTDVVELDLSSVEASISGPKRPQDRIALSKAKESWQSTLPKLKPKSSQDGDSPAPCSLDGNNFNLEHGHVAIAAITSCTNTSNPSVMFAAGLLARNALKRGLDVKPWVKTSLAPGSKVVSRYLEESGLMESLESLRFNVVGYGCTTCIGNSGPLPDEISKVVRQKNLVMTSVLSGNRNFEGRINQDVRGNYLASPPLVVAYAIAGTMDFDFEKQALGKDADGQDVFLKDIWPEPREVEEFIQKWMSPEAFKEEYASVFDGDPAWKALPTPEGNLYAWDAESTYVQEPPFFQNLGPTPEPNRDIEGARVLLMLGDSVTTDHISPAGNIPADSPAGKYLQEHGVSPRAFNSYGSRRGNHEVMMRGTFANIRIQNQLTPDREGGYSIHLPTETQGAVFDVAMKYQAEQTPLIVLGGKEYGSGSSRDWAAKGTLLLGVRAVLAESYERIHRSNLVGMGVLPLQYMEGDNRKSLGLDGTEQFTISGIARDLKPGSSVQIKAKSKDGKETKFLAKVRIDTAVELAYYENGGILSYVLRSLVSQAKT